MALARAAALCAALSLACSRSLADASGGASAAHGDGGASAAPPAAPTPPSPLPSPPPAGWTGDTFLVRTVSDEASRIACEQCDLRAPDCHCRGVFERVLTGLCVRGTQAAIADMAHALDFNISYVEYDLGTSRDALVTQEDAWWGLDRIDQRALPLDGEYAYETCDEAAPATDVYIFDTGVRCSHMEFDALAPGGARRCVGAWDAYNPGAGDVRECANAPPGSQDSCARDNDSHGTHVAATAAGARWGVDKCATTRVMAVKVLDDDGAGTFGDVLLALDFVVKQRDAGGLSEGRNVVASMSLSGAGTLQAIDDAILAAKQEGVLTVVSAGNQNGDACARTPARSAEALTVGSTDESDARSPFSNYGNCLQLFAPGSNIRSACASGDNCASTLSGTSMATPHVAGALSIALRARGLLVIDEMAAEKLRQETVANGGSVVTAGIVGDAKSPNNLLLSMVGLTGTRAPTAAPTNAPTETPTTAFPTSSPVEQPTASDAPTSTPTPVPTQAPTNVDSLSSCVNSCNDYQFACLAPPTIQPTEVPTISPTSPPTSAPTVRPTQAPTGAPTSTPTGAPTALPTSAPITIAPSAQPTTSGPAAAVTGTDAPASATPSSVPTATPTVASSPPETSTASPTPTPTTPPSASPSASPTMAPTTAPTTASPTMAPTNPLTYAPTGAPVSPQAGSCVGGSCGGPAPQNSCFCDPICETFQDCCLDYIDVCVGLPPTAAPSMAPAPEPTPQPTPTPTDGSATPAPSPAPTTPPPTPAPTAPQAPAQESCAAACGGVAPGGACYCDSACLTFQDCCQDACSQCPAEVGCG